ncbi:MAG: DUF3352 domain-containing protein [Candidatus Sumerlaeaceae bacterium]|nr:DUF3352 domain-containing protein [Candidatus Sumerlaeaceae bacterium]
MSFLTRRSGSFALVAAAALTIGATGSAEAKLATANIVPAKSAYVASVPDVPATWKAFKASSAYGIYQKILDVPALKDGLDDVLGQLKPIEEGLGFKLNGDTLSGVFAGVDIFAVAGDSADKVALGIVAKVGDKEKLAKLMDLAEKAAAKAASSSDDSDKKDKDSDKSESKDEKASDKSEKSESKDSEKKEEKTDEKKSDEKKSDNSMGGAEESAAKSDEKSADKAADKSEKSADKSASDDKPASAVTTSEYKGVKVKKFSSGDAEAVLVAEVGDLLLLSNDKSTLEALINHAKGEDKTGTIEGSDLYKKASAALGDSAADIYVFNNDEAASKLVKSDPQMAKLDELMSKLSPSPASATSVKIAEKEFVTRWAVPVENADWKALLAKYAAKPLEAAAFVPADAVAAGATNIFDAKMALGFVQQVASTIGGMSDEDFDKQVSGMDAQVGFSITKDLVPAIGNDLGVSLNSVKPGMGFPTIDAAIILGVADKAKMDKVLAAVDKLIENALKAAIPPSAEGTGDAAPTLKSEKVGDATVKSVQLPIPGLLPCYATDGKFVLIGTNKESIVAMLELKSGKGSALTAGSDFKALGSQVSASCNSLKFVNIEKIVEIADGFLGASPAAVEIKPVLEALGSLHVAGASSASKDGAYVGTAVVRFK